MSISNRVPLFHGCRSIDCYKRINYIDEGTYGMVFKAQCKDTNDIVAIKQVKITNLSSKVGFPITALRETNIMMVLSHPNIVKVREMVIGTSVDKVYMVMDYCATDLKQCMESSARPFSLGETKRIMLQLFDAVEYIHDKWILHRDIKTSNILYTNKGKICLCDFGMARQYGSPIQPYTNEVVTLWYRSCELLLGSTTYGPPLDVWSLGCIYGEILSGGKPLFMGQGELDQINKIFSILGAPTEEKWPGAAKLPLYSKVSYRVPSKSKLRDLFPSYVAPGGSSNNPNSNVRGIISLTESGYNLLSGLLNMDPKQRTTAREAMQHEWYHEEPSPTPLELMPVFDQKA